METISTIFATAVKSLIKDSERGTKARLAREAGISFSQLSDILTGRRYGTEDQRRAVAKALGWDYGNLLRLGECLNLGKPYEEIESESNNDFFRIPLLGIDQKASSDTAIVVHGPTIGRKNANQIIALHAPDDSMEPLIAQGGLVVVDSSITEIKNINDNSIYVVSELQAKKWQIRQLEVASKDLIAVKPILNDKYQTTYQKPSELRLLGKAIWASRLLN